MKFSDHEIIVRENSRIKKRGSETISLEKIHTSLVGANEGQEIFEQSKFLLDKYNKKKKSIIIIFIYFVCLLIFHCCKC